MSKNKKKFRMVHNSFWSDPKIVEEFTPEDKLVFLYLMTNSLSTQIGIYPITRKHIAYETGYSQESIKSIMDRFIHTHKVIKYDEETRELFIINWGKHNYRSGGTPMYDLVRSELSGIKNKGFVKEASDIVESDTIKSIFNEFLNDESCNESCNESDIESNDESCNESGYEKENKKENENEKKKEKKPKRQQVDYDSDFQEFKNEYPKFVDPALTRRSYEKARKNKVTHEQIMFGVRKFVEEVKATGMEKKYMKNSSTWLNAGSYLNYGDIESANEVAVSIEDPEAEARRNQWLKESGLL